MFEYLSYCNQELFGQFHVLAELTLLSDNFQDSSCKVRNGKGTYVQHCKHKDVFECITCIDCMMITRATPFGHVWPCSRMTSMETW